MRHIGPQPSEVLIIRSGYASEALWLAAIRQAVGHHRSVRAIDAEGRVLAELPEDDW